MNPKNEEVVKLTTKLISELADLVTCVQCCKYYIAPVTASCGHTLCHTCWRGQISCPVCAKPTERKTLKQNHPIKKLTENVHEMVDSFQKKFKVNVSDVMLELDSEPDPTKNVKDWLASSQNHFSAAVQSFERGSHEMAELQNPMNVSSNKNQVHTNTSKAKNSDKMIYVSTIPQDDWDKIEPMPDTEDIIEKGKENVVGPMDIEPFCFDDDNEYTAINPRRSARKRGLKQSSEITNVTNNKIADKLNSKDSSDEIDKKSNIAKQNWNNVKRMRKEFSKLNKKNRNKLNVSIEMCKKTQSTAKTFDAFPQALSSHFDIDENTPSNNLHTIKVPKEHKSVGIEKATSNLKENFPDANIEEIENIISTKTKISNLEPIDNENNSGMKNNDSRETSQFTKDNITDGRSDGKNTGKSPFYKMGSLNSKSVPANHFQKANSSKIVNHTIDSNTNANDDIEITIKVGNTITNIVIKKKNDIDIKVNTDREIQTSLDQQDNEKIDSPRNSRTQNNMTIVGDNHEVDVKHQEISNPRIKELKKLAESDKTSLDKKNTDSADTAMAQFEITESVEKELSKVMDFEDVEKTVQPKSTYLKKSSNPDKSEKVPTNPDDNEYIHDSDIFESDSIREPQVKYINDTEQARSEILVSTVKTKNKTQRATEKRTRRPSDEDALPNLKKVKYDEDTSIKRSRTLTQVSNVINKQNQPDSEPMNYDAIIGTVFANIDADMEETRQSQNVIKNTYTLASKNAKSQHKTFSQVKKTQVVVLPAALETNISSQLIDKCNNQDSENVFTVCGEKEDENVDTAPLTSANKKMPSKVVTSNIDEFLTPIMSQAVDNDIEMVNDDSDKSVVEETPQKTTSFTKTKQKSNGANMEANQSQRVETSQPTVSSKKDSSGTNMNSIISLTDTSLEIKSNANETAHKVDNKQTDTPLTINKFVNQIEYNSTPFARKSLNFYGENDDLTLCATNAGIANTTQEREFMIKAFEKTPTPTVATVRPQGLRSLGLKHTKYVIAGSSLTSDENVYLKKLCAKHKWIYTNKYTKDITHLVVGVDEENKAQRTVKYMCALAASKWIISYGWVEKCLQSKEPVNEIEYEVLDNTGDPGPMLSRIATKKLFLGITFFCMEPFSLLDVDTLKSMLISAGGKVVEDAKQVRVGDRTSEPALLLAEPENTQEDRFIYLAMELSIVPVNYEWVLNCLGSYTLSSIQELLLCPASLLPKATASWPQELLARDYDDD